MKKMLAAALAVLVLCAADAAAQRSGGVLRFTHRDNPASLSIHEEGTNSVLTPMMPVFNNLVVYDQHKPQNSMETIVPELATSWTWNEARDKLTFALREGVRWHDGKPFTAEDVRCTWDLLLGRAKEKFRLNFRGAWYANLDDVTIDAPTKVTFHLKRPQPAFIALLASGYTPVYPCHVHPNAMRTKPIGTGPFKFVEFKANDSIKLAKNTDYWKPGLPYLDGIEFTIIPNRSTAILAFSAEKFDVTFPWELSIPLARDVKSSAPWAVCEITSTNVSTNLLVNSQKAPFDNAEVRRGMALTLDRKSFIDILSEGKADQGGAMLAPPEGVWGMPPEMLARIPGYGPDVAANRAEAQRIMRAQGYGPDKRLSVKVSTRNIAPYRDPAVILIDQLKHVFIDGELDVIDTSIWHAKVARKDFVVALNLTGSGVDDPDQQFYENYACGSQRNYTSYCNPEIEALIDKQSRTIDQDARRKIVWEIDRKLQEDVARPLIFHGRSATCWHPKVKNMTLMVNSIYNGWRMEDVWLEDGK
jgi:peptide/nickel transport system substrate-binding protein